MFEIIKIKTDNMMPVIIRLLQEGKKVRFTVTGNSMYPFLREGKDSVELGTCNYPKLAVGDIILIQRHNNEYVLHRVIFKKRDIVYINGDAQQTPEGPINRMQIIARVDTVWRGNKKIDTRNLNWRLLVYLWLLLLPFHKLILRGYRLFRNLQWKSRRTPDETKNTNIKMDG